MQTTVNEDIADGWNAYIDTWYSFFFVITLRPRVE